MDDIEQLRAMIDEAAGQPREEMPEALVRAGKDLLPRRRRWPRTLLITAGLVAVALVVGAPKWAGG